MRILIALVLALCGCHLSQVDPERKAAARTQIHAFGEALETYHADTGIYPTQAQGLAALRIAPPGVNGWHGPYLPKEIPNDPWGRPYVYIAPRSPSTPPTITSLGRPD